MSMVESDLQSSDAIPRRTVMLAAGAAGLLGVVVLALRARRSEQSSGSASEPKEQETLYLPTRNETNYYTIGNTTNNTTNNGTTGPGGTLPGSPGNPPIEPYPTPLPDRGGKPEPLPRNPGPLDPNDSIKRCLDGSLPDADGSCVSPGGFPYWPDGYVPPVQAGPNPKEAISYQPVALDTSNGMPLPKLPGPLIV